MAETRSLTAPPGAAQRADQLLADLLGVSRRAAQALLDEGRARVARGARLRKGDRVEPGTALEVRVDEGPFVVPEPALPFVVVHEDEAVVVVDKPAGLPTHPLRHGETGTAANAAVARYPELAALRPEREAGVVHRLDTGTSGLLVFARTQGAYDALRAAFSEGRVGKTYLALCVGAPPERGIVARAIGHEGRAGGRARVASAESGGLDDAGRGAQYAESRFEVARRYEGFTLVRVDARTGRMHQVRAHLASIGFPLAGDAEYQDDAARAADTLGLAHPFLHAEGLDLPHPSRGGRLALRCELPEKLRAILASLRPV